MYNYTIHTETETVYNIGTSVVTRVRYCEDYNSANYMCMHTIIHAPIPFEIFMVIRGPPASLQNLEITLLFNI